MQESVHAGAIRRMFETVSLGSPENATGFLFWRITARYQREMDRALATIGLTNLQFVTLTLTAWFSRTGHPASQAELARFAGIHAMQLSLMLKALESKGMIKREPSPQDTRAKQVAITRNGLKAIRESLPVAVALQERLFGKEGRPGGGLHHILLELDRELAEEKDF